MASIVFDDTFEVNGVDNEKFDNVSRVKAKVRIPFMIPVVFFLGPNIPG